MIILFKTSTCGACKLIASHLKELEVNYKECIVDESDEAEELAEKYNINAVPTILFLNKNNEEKTRISGAVGKPMLEALIKKLHKYEDQPGSDTK